VIFVGKKLDVFGAGIGAYEDHRDVNGRHWGSGGGVAWYWVNPIVFGGWRK
jgi:hypothetical protein